MSHEQKSLYVHWMTMEVQLGYRHNKYDYYLRFSFQAFSRNSGGNNLQTYQLL